MSNLNSYTGNVEVIDGLTPANGQDFALMQAHHIQVDENGKRLDEKLDEMGTGGGSAIIDVTSLPTENIDEESFYRLYTGTMYFNGFAQKTVVYVVETLPETGNAVTTNMQTIDYVYYGISENGLFVYADETLSSATGGAVTVGFHPFQTFIASLGYAYGGVVTSLDAMTAENTFYLYLEYKLYSYKEKWEAVKGIGWEGEGMGAEVFNDPSNVASGDKSHAEGYDTEASDDYSHAEGWDTKASGRASHAEGTDTTASGSYSHAEGQGTIASGFQSHAEGGNTEARGGCSHAEGESTIATGFAQHVQGKYNIEDENERYAHIVGNGDNINRSNAHTLDWQGNAWFAGKVKVGGTGYDDANAVELGAGGGGGSYVLELSAESGTLTDEQYNAVVANAPNVVAFVLGELYVPFKSTDGTHYEFDYVAGEFPSDDSAELISVFVNVNSDKTYNITMNFSSVATTTYVDNAVANAGGGSSGGGIIDVTELPRGDDINENAIYRLSRGLYYGTYKQGTTYIVTQLPSVGEPCTTDGQTIATTYYNATDKILYGYVPAAVGSALGAPEGWYQISMLLENLGYEYGGNIQTLADMTSTSVFYMVVLDSFAACKDSNWTFLNGKSGGSSGGSGVILATIDIKNSFSAEGTLTEFDAAYPARLIIKLNFSFGSNSTDFCLTFKEITISSENDVSYKYTGTHGEYEAVCEVKADGTYTAGLSSLGGNSNIAGITVAYHELFKLTTSGSYTLNGKVLTLTAEVTQSYAAGNTFAQHEWYVRSGKWGTLAKATKTDNGWSCAYGDGATDTGVTGTVEITKSGTVILTADQDLSSINSTHLGEIVDHLTGNISAGFLNTEIDTVYK